MSDSTIPGEAEMLERLEAWMTEMAALDPPPTDVVDQAVARAVTGAQVQPDGPDAWRRRTLSQVVSASVLVRAAAAVLLVGLAFGLVRDHPRSRRVARAARANHINHGATGAHHPGSAPGIRTLRTPETVQQDALAQIAYWEAQAGFVVAPARIVSVEYLGPNDRDSLAYGDYARWLVVYDGTVVVCSSWCSVHRGGTEIIPDDGAAHGGAADYSLPLCVLSGSPGPWPENVPDCADMHFASLDQGGAP